MTKGIIRKRNDGTTEIRIPFTPRAGWLYRNWSDRQYRPRNRRERRMVARRIHAMAHPLTVTFSHVRHDAYERMPFSEP